MSKILVVDDELSMREFLEIMLKKAGYDVETVEDPNEAILRVDSENYDLVITDVLMPRMDGVELLRKIKEISPETTVLMMTAYAATETAVQAMKEGAYDYITKPFKVDEIQLIIEKALEKKRLFQENVILKQELKIRYNFGNLIGSSAEMLKVYDLIQRVTETKANILITGESGTGKELVAKAIHHNSARRDRPFVTVNCGAIPENLLESELFGHVKGSFTGAVSNKMGLFELADRGTIFLDEVGELTLTLQVKLLRVIQEKTFKRVGGTEEQHVDVRVITATNRDLEEEVSRARFREDLYYRLNVIQIKLPPLRRRIEDIPVLAQHFVEKYSLELGKEVVKISKEAMDVLIRYHYPGNVRELENIIERSVALETSSIILPETLPPVVHKRERDLVSFEEVNIPPEGLPIEKVVEDLERRLLMSALRKAGGVKKRAAKILHLSFRSFRYRLEKYGIELGDS
ncbi:MAG: sigma-54 dependent transcriptional regulator [Deltaproteobacteria bacterium]|nr:sigma-54 dependent transcriptional regulator [Deltaproteobacteria bacterium]